MFSSISFKHFPCEILLPSKQRVEISFLIFSVVALTSMSKAGLISTDAIASELKDVDTEVILN